jgi:hypothetical protein
MQKMFAPGAAALALFLCTSPGLRAQALDQTIGGCGGVAPTRTIQATPSTYRSLLAGLQPGDRLLLAAGTYTQQIRLNGLNGQPNRCIVIEGPASGSPALFTGSDTYNTISLQNVSYLVFRNLSLDGLGKAGDGVKAEAGSTYAHHITLDNLKLRNYFGGNLNRCGISTKSRAWNWVVRRVDLLGAGVGMYFGKPDGTAEFANSLIENNVIAESRLYDIEIKHQLGRATSLGMPVSGTTVIRRNVFTKEKNAATGSNARPNLLVGHWPLSGAGSSDVYQIYGNVFYLNPTEALFQGEGNVVLHDNLFVQRSFTRAIRIQPHHDKPRRIDIFNNTIVAPGEGILITGANTAYPQRVVGNAVFAAQPLSGGQQSGNVTGAYAAAAQSLTNPAGSLAAGTLDLYPLPGKLQGSPISLSFLTGLADPGVDFNRLPRLDSFRGAYSGDGVNPGWQPSLAIQP